MAIHILPAKLANQIAAGEVVERPASVVKELVENAIDAGATRIEVEIERGGHRLIRVHDNGCGIVKEELQLALNRHATSKIDDFSDLEAIATLGFRGEALASISSVSRLTLTSRTAGQSEAWQAFAEGLDMAVTVEPAAHPVGTTVAVADLFFNTPARRKFLRSEKTELAHIEQLLKRLALANFSLSLQLNHNGKRLRRYPAGDTERLRLKRLAAICGDHFAERALQIDSQFEHYRLHGWLLDEPTDGHPVNQFIYVNQRVVRDKLLNHAIRQACSEHFADPAQVNFVLYLELSHDQVDVNVHPSKHEVRFHQARLVHDFVVKALQQALAQSNTLLAVDPETGEWLAPTQTEEPAADYRPKKPPVQDMADRPAATDDVAQGKTAGQGPFGSFHYPRAHRERPSASAVRAYQSLLSEAANLVAPSGADDQTQSQNVTHSEATRWLLALDERHWLVFWRERLWCADLARADIKMSREQAKPWFGQLLLMPIALPVSVEDSNILQQKAGFLSQYGLEITLPSPQKLVIRQLPELLRGVDWGSQLTPFMNTLTQPADLMLAEWIELAWAQQPSLRVQALQTRFPWSEDEAMADEYGLRPVTAEQLRPLLLTD